MPALLNPQLQTEVFNRQSYAVTTATNGVFLEAGPAGPDALGVWTLEWCPDNGFDGSIVVYGRISGVAANKDGVPFVPIPYLALYLNGRIVTPQPGTRGAYGNDPITGSSLIEIGTGALSVGLLVTCNAGTGMLYARDAGGSA